MIRSLLQALETHPELGKVVVSGFPLESWALAKRLDGIEGKKIPLNLASILTTDRAEEVGEMVGVVEWNACGECNWNGGSERLVVVTGGIAECPSCGAPCVDMLPVTARLFLWTGEPVEWENLFDATGIRRSPEWEWIQRLTAVVLVGDATVINLLAGLSTEAARACAEAGVQFVIPGHPERGRIEL